MLFATQEKADNFIKFNKEEILDEKGRAPVRSYYCRLCNGYHVTSNPSLTEGEIRDKSDEKLLQDVIKCIEIEKACKSSMCFCRSNNFYRLRASNTIYTRCI